MPCLGVVLYGEGEEGRARRGAQLEYGFVAVAIESSASAGRNGRVLDPDLESAVGANGGYEVGMYGWGQPLNLCSPLESIQYGRSWMGTPYFRISAVWAVHVSHRIHEPLVWRL